MDRYINENPTEFPTLLIDQAKSARYKMWLHRGISLMEGKFKGGSPVVWQTMMRNMFRDVGWDKDFSNNNANQSTFNKYIDKAEKEPSE